MAVLVMGTNCRILGAGGPNNIEYSQNKDGNLTLNFKEAEVGYALTINI